MRVIPSILFSLIAYFMTGLQRSAAQFLIFLITIFMVSVFGSALCFFVAAAIPTLSTYRCVMRSIDNQYTIEMFLSASSYCLDCRDSSLRDHDDLQWVSR